MFSRLLGRAAGLTAGGRHSSSTVFFAPRKFYKEVSVNFSEQDGYEVCLDKRVLKTPQGKRLELHSEPLALAIAQEWDSQKETIRIPAMRLTGLAFSAQDNPTHESSESLVQKVLEYLDSDTILYLDTSPAELAALEREKWLPVVDWANRAHGLALRPSYSVAEVADVPEESRTRLRRHLEAMNFHALTGLAYGVESVKSVLLVLACLQHRLSAEEAATLANLEQDYQTRVYQKIEGHHDVHELELVNRLSAALLFAHFTSNLHKVTRTKVPLCSNS